MRPVVEVVIAEIARRQHGVIAYRQLREAGLTAGSIRHRVRSGRLHPLHRGVFLVGSGLSYPRTREIAAVIALGPAAVVSHRTAAMLFGILRGDGGAVDVTVLGANRGSRPGIRSHRSRALGRGDTGTVDGIPVTSPARTLLDIAPLISRRELAWAYNEALIQDLTTPQAIRALLDRTHGHPGSRSLEAICENAAPQRTAGELERRVLDALRRARVAAPRTQVRLMGWEVDFYWPEHGLVLEADGYKFHHAPQSWRRDRRKQADLENHGLRVLRTDWEEVTERPESMVARVLRAQFERSGPASPATSAATTPAPRNASRASTA